MKCAKCEEEIKLNSKSRYSRKNNKNNFCSPECCQKFFQNQPSSEGVKVCVGCDTPLPHSEFRFKDNKKKYLLSLCKKCFSTYTARRYNAKKIAGIKYLGGKCNKCGKTFHPASYHFHHRDPSTKEFSWNILRRQSLETMKRELDKCDLLCSSCHHETHCHSEWDDLDEMANELLAKLLRS